MIEYKVGINFRECGGQEGKIKSKKGWEEKGWETENEVKIETG